MHFIEGLINGMIQSERDFIKRKNISPCNNEECMRSKIWKKHSKSDRGKKINDDIYTQQKVYIQSTNFASKSMNVRN